MSLVRVGLAETKDFADGYDAIFGKKPAVTPEPAKKPDETPPAKPVADVKK